MVPPTLHNAKELQGKSLLYGKIKLLEKKNKINTTLNDICLVQFPILIPLCWMVGMEVVKPTLDDNIAILSRSFHVGYILGSTTFYMVLEHFLEDGYIQEVNDDIRATWDDAWKEKNEVFETFLRDNNLSYFSNKMFFIWDGNDKFKAWYKNKSENFQDVDYHIAPTSIVLDGQEKIMPSSHQFVMTLTHVTHFLFSLVFATILNLTTCFDSIILNSFSYQCAKSFKKNVVKP